jgi:hypothetical protein
VSQSDLTALGALRGFLFRMLANVEGVEIVAQCHKHRVFLGDDKAEHIAVEPH